MGSATTVTGAPVGQAASPLVSAATAGLPLACPAARRRNGWARCAELAVCVVALGALGALMCTAHVRHGGLYFDDWAVAELVRFPPAGGLLHALRLYYGQRPGQVVYYGVVGELLGGGPSAHLALAAAMAVLGATAFYALLRRLGLAPRDALACAALALAFPFSDSVWLWGILSLASLAIALWLAGVTLALRALQSTGARSRALHGLSLGVYVAGILSYEVTAAAGCLAGVLYVRSVGLARARARWALDVVVIAAAALLPRLLLPIDIATPSRTLALSAIPAHAVQIASGGARVAGGALLPLTGVSPWVGAGLLVLSGCAAAVARRGGLLDPGTRAALGRWLAGAGAGAALAAAAWAVYLPAPAHYLPDAPGPVDRVNALAAFGVAALVYCMLGALGCLLASVLGLSRRRGALIAPLLALALCIGYLHRDAADSRWWNRAADQQRAILAGLHSALGRPAPGRVIYTLGTPATVGPGVPVLGTALDLTSAVRISFANASLRAVPLASARALRCGARGPSAGREAGSYGASYLIDVAERSSTELSSRSRCAAAVALLGRESRASA